MKLYLVDSFTDHVFGGGPAGVCITQEWLPDSRMQEIAAELNAADTIFIVPRGEYYEARWFMPDGEITLNGHCTLAAGEIIFHLLEWETEEIHFVTPHHELFLHLRDGKIEMDFPAVKLHEIETTEEIVAALGKRPAKTYFWENYFCVFDTEEEVRSIEPDYNLMKMLPLGQGVFISAKADEGTGFDIVDRAFWPKMGVNEDPVCGNMHCNLIPYWCEKLGKNRILSHQVSPRGAVVIGEIHGDRVKLIGEAVVFAELVCPWA